MNIELDVPVGAFREFTKDELKTLNELLEASTKTHESKLVEREGRTLTKKQMKPKTEEPKESRSTRRINRRRD